jgi:hypothetical protein
MEVRASLPLDPQVLEVLVHAESDQARGFYAHLIPKFEHSPTDPPHLLLLPKDSRRPLGSRQR